MLSLTAEEKRNCLPCFSFFSFFFFWSVISIHRPLLYSTHEHLNISEKYENGETNQERESDGGNGNGNGIGNGSVQREHRARSFFANSCLMVHEIFASYYL